mgnify:CR=1 FL=1
MEQVHTLLNNLLFHIPAAAQAVWTAVQETYPHKTFSGEVQRTFLTHVLWLTTYCPALKERLLLLAVDRLLHIDVRVLIFLSSSLPRFSFCFFAQK